uniref:Testicular haploid expressed gene protein-like n=1 Tax=Homalodisca liturata TaxID=320908 RepID=A0A1B6IB11_9HEMI
MHFSKRFKRAWMKSNQRMHDMLLARPRTRYLQRWPDPALERTLPAEIPAAAMRAKPTARTLELAKPKTTFPSMPPKELPTIVEPWVLKYEPTQRIMELARPARKGKRSKEFKARTSRTKRKQYSQERLLTLAKRKPSHHPPAIKKKPAKPLNELLPRIKILSELPRRYQSPDLPKIPVVRKLRLDPKSFEPSERTKNLAQPREYNEFKLDEDYDPYLINPAALTYVATDNIKKLAEPRHKEEKRIKK